MPRKISPETQLDIFEEVFLRLIEYPSFRWQLKTMIESRDSVDQASLDLDLRKIELEIIKRRGI